MATQATPLPSLHPETPLAPQNLTQRSRLLAALGRVTSVRVPTSVKQDGHRFYVVEVTTPRLHAVVPPPVQYRFADFVNLRDELSYHIRRGHRDQKRPCAFCLHARDTLAHAASLPRLHQLVFADPDAICRAIEGFLNTALQLAQSVKHHLGLAWCPGQGMVPLLVKRFLLGKGGREEHDASVSPRSASACRVDPFRPAASVGLAFS